MSFTSSRSDAPLVIWDVGDPNFGVDSGSISPDSLVQSPTTSTSSTVGLSRNFFDFELSSQETAASSHQSPPTSKKGRPFRKTFRGNQHTLHKKTVKLDESRPHKNVGHRLPRRGYISDILVPRISTKSQMLCHYPTFNRIVSVGAHKPRGMRLLDMHILSDVFACLGLRRSLRTL